ncbi:hypothetical protein [Candidatus Binatus sp.]|uniref:hypothetical protein n=1 Tax=Candidatus Binatus sp. TaxID=2811406 RepID=UPI003CC6708F
MLRLTPQEKRLNAFEELAGIRKESKLIARAHNAEQYFSTVADANINGRTCA